MPKKKTFWPYGILLSIFAIVLACIATIIFASNYPVYEDDFYFERYQKVESDFDQIQNKQKNFDKIFTLTLELDKKVTQRKVFYKLSKNQKELSILIKQEKEDFKNSDLKTTLLLTRPHTNAQDEFLQAQIIQKNPYIYILKTTLPDLESGRWQLKIKLEKDPNTIGFFNFELLAQ